MRLPRPISNARVRRVAMLFALPIMVTAFVAPITTELTSNDTAAQDPRLDELTLQAVLATASAPVEPETDPTTTTSTTALPAPTTTTVAPTTTTTTIAPSSIGNSGGFALGPGAKLPSDKDCAKLVTKAKEVRPENKTANNAKVKAPKLGPNWGSDPEANRMLSRVSGNYQGTTDEIIQWAACKWGFETDVVRAQVMVESSWRQSATNAVTEDQALCPAGMTAPCPLAFGLLQIRLDHQPGTYPAAAQSTAYNLDYGMAMKRACYEGHSWLGSQTKGDAWGCTGVHYSGKYLDDDAKAYIEKVKSRYASKAWKRL